MRCCEMSEMRKCCMCGKETDSVEYYNQRKGLVYCGRQCFFKYQREGNVTP